MNNWELKRIDKVVDIRRGASPRPIDNFLSDNGMPWVKISDATANSGRFLYETKQFIIQEGVKNSVIVNPEDLIISNSATPALPKILKIRACVHDGWLIVSNYKGVTRDFLYYSILYNRKWLLNQGNGSIFKNLKTEILKEFKIKIPSINIQNQVTDVLKSIEDKIELNNRINAELEAMAKTMYDYWFVQFDFPDENGNPYKTSGGKMVWNAELKREIPEGWEVKKLSEWINIDKSGDWGKEKPEGNFTLKVICFRGADINGLNGLDELKPPVRFILEKNSFKILKSHDLIIEISGGSPTQSTGRLAFITDTTIKRFELPLICSNFCKPVSMRNKNHLYNFVYYWNSLYENGVFFGYEGKTSGIKNLLFESFINSYDTIVPNEKIVNQFYSIMETIQEKKQTALAENQKLTELRDWLLPMLMNGQVKVNS